MRYAVFNDPDSCVVLWSTVEELVNMNMGRFMDGARLLGLLRLCATPEDAKRAVAAMSPLAQSPNVVAPSAEVRAKIAQIVGSTFKRTA